jgi:hypothetical protein
MHADIDAALLPNTQTDGTAQYQDVNASDMQDS